MSHRPMNAIPQKQHIVGFHVQILPFFKGLWKQVVVVKRHSQQRRRSFGPFCCCARGRIMDSGVNIKGWFSGIGFGLDTVSTPLEFTKESRKGLSGNGITEKGQCQVVLVQEMDCLANIAKTTTTTGRRRKEWQGVSLCNLTDPLVIQTALAKTHVTMTGMTAKTTIGRHVPPPCGGCLTTFPIHNLGGFPVAYGINALDFPRQQIHIDTPIIHYTTTTTMMIIIFIRHCRCRRRPCRFLMRKRRCRWVTGVVTVKAVAVVDGPGGGPHNNTILVS